jgi:hypothetical protein
MRHFIVKMVSTSIEKEEKTYRKEWLRRLVLPDYLIDSCQVKPVEIIGCHILNTLSNSSWPKN